MRPARIVALVAGCLIALPGVGMMIGGGALGIAGAVARDDQGYFDTNLDRIGTDTVAVTSDEVTFGTEPGAPDWLMDRLDIDLRLRADAVSEQPIFIGIARTADVDDYLDGLAHIQVTDVHDGFEPVYEAVAGAGTAVAPPTGQDFWVATASGSGEQELVWEAEGGRWTAVLMNADGSRGLAADVNVGVKAGFLGPLALTLLIVGAVVTAIGVFLIVFGARGLRGEPPAGDRDDEDRGLPGTPLFAPPFGFAAPAEPRPVAAGTVQVHARWSGRARSRPGDRGGRAAPRIDERAGRERR